MGEQIKLTASDGFELDAYVARPDGQAKGAVIVIQEIFGVNQHIREVTDGFAADGYVAIAPALFDRLEKNVELDYTAENVQKGAGMARGKLDWEDSLKDLQAAIDHAGQYGKVGAVGYCFGGLMAWLCAGRAAALTCAVGYYGGGIQNALDVEPQIPILLHFGKRDNHIPMADVEKIMAAYPDVPAYIYEADHGFNCDRRRSYDERAATLARERTLEFFATYL